VSKGVKVTPWLVVPTAGIVAGVVNENVPATLATPELNVDALSA
jgi:hypothetical protein